MIAIGQLNMYVVLQIRCTNTSKIRMALERFQAPQVNKSQTQILSNIFSNKALVRIKVIYKSINSSGPLSMGAGEGVSHNPLTTNCGCTSRNL